MRDRTEKILRLACLILAALVLSQLLRTGFHVSRFFGVKIPAIPTLQTNAVARTSPMPVSAPGAPASAVTPPATNLPATAGPITTSQTNASTNVLTNAVAVKFMKSTGTNLVLTNVVRHAGTNDNGTNRDGAVAMNSPPGMMAHRHLPPMMPGGMGFGGMPGMPGMPGGQSPLPPEIQARVDKIVNSEIFAPVMHPMPMTLMGIAGDTAFLRTDSGQTGLVKVGDSLGDVKVVAIGINRVLVEQGGQKKELTIFDGYGGDSLLSQTDKSSK